MYRLYGGGYVLKAFSVVGVGGTFDHLHEGHKLLIKTAYDLGNTVHIGITSEKMIKYKRYQEQMQSYDDRLYGILNFTEKLPNYKDTKLVISEINNPYEIDDEIVALIVSEETYENALKIRKINHHDFFIIVIPTLMDDDKKISSTDIREFIKWNTQLNSVLNLKNQ